MKKLISLVLALAMILMVGAAFATEPNHTITIDNSVAGTQYTAYKLLDATVNDDNNPTLFSYTVNSDWDTFFADANSATWGTVFRKTTAGNIEALDSVTNDSAALKAFARAAAAYAATNSIDNVGTAQTATGETSVEFSTADGYYLIVSSLGSNIMLNTTPGNKTIHEKNEVPTIEKKISENSALVDANDANIGDDVDYQVTVAVKAGTDHYVVTDTFSAGLTYNNNLAISATTGANPVKDTDYTVSYNSESRVLTITFTDTYINTLTNKNGAGAATNDTLTFTYSAKINANAVIKDTANPNTVRLTYQHNGTSDYQEDTVKTFTYGFDVFKKNAKNEALAGAKFNLKLGSTVLYFTSATVSGHTVYTYAGTTSGDGKTSVLETPTSGYIYIKGLDAGAYTLHETEAPTGYNPLANDITVTISATITNGELQSYNVTASGDTGIVSAGTHTGHYYNDNTSGDLVKEVDVLNNQGTVLPSTGGIGTTIFYILGGLLVVGAAVILVARRKASN